MKKDIQTNGFFWQPKSPEIKIHGDFSYVSDKKLLLTTHEQSSIKSGKEDLQDIPIIHGSALNGKCLTLINCMNHGRHTNMSLGIQDHKLEPQIAYIGSQHLPENNLNFRSVNVQLHLAMEWHAKGGFQIDHGENIGDLDVKYRDPDTIDISINDDFKLKIYRHLKKVPFGGPCTDQINLREIVSFEIRPKSPKPIEYFRERIYALRNFLTISCNQPSHILKFTAEANFTIDYKSQKKTPVFMDVLFIQPSHRSNDEEVDNWNFLFNYSEIENDFEDVLNNWFNVEDKIKPIVYLYISALHSPFSYIETEFLSLVQAAESYHRRFIGGNFLESKDFKSKVVSPLVEAIPNDIDPDLKELITIKIGFMNEYSLMQRLSGLTDEHSEILDPFFSDTLPILKEIVKFRNHLTHYTKKIDVGEHIQELAIYSMFLKFLLELCFLHELGIQSSEVVKLLERNFRYKNTLNTIEKHITSTLLKSRKP